MNTTIPCAEMTIGTYVEFAHIGQGPSQPVPQCHVTYVTSTLGFNA